MIRGHYRLVQRLVSVSLCAVVTVDIWLDEIVFALSSSWMFIVLVRVEGEGRQSVNLLGELAL